MDVRLMRKVGSPSSAQARSTFGPPSRPSSPTKTSRPISRPTSPHKNANIPTPSPSPHAGPPRPRAKVSTSANIGASKKPYGGLSPNARLSGGSGSTTPRAQSPVRQLDRNQPKLSPRPVAGAFNRKSSVTASSAPSSPRMQNTQSASPSLPSAISNGTLAKPFTPRVRHSSISSSSQVSAASSARASSVLSASPSMNSSTEPGQTVKIRAKVTGIVKPKPQTPHTPPNPSPLYIPSTPEDYLARPQTAVTPTSNFRTHVGRTGSIGSLSGLEASLNGISPGTSSSLSGRRYSTVRSPPSSISQRPTPSFTTPPQGEMKVARVDPALIPLPPLSPPASNVSYSSRSSASRSSLSQSSASSTSRSAVPEIGINGHIDPSLSSASMGAFPRPRTNSLVIHDANALLDHNDFSSETSDRGEERTIRAEAKSYRKIADLEITTRSLLAINTQLEASKHKQAKEISDLKRKLRESRLILPPRKYAEVKASIPDDDDEEEDIDIAEHEGGEEDEEDENAEAIRMGKDDEPFNRVRLIIEGLLESGRNALNVKAEDFGPTKGGAKVLHESEARNWRYSSHNLTLPESREDTASFDGTYFTADSGDEAESTRRLSSVSRRLHQSRKSEAEVEEIIGDFRSSFNVSS